MALCWSLSNILFKDLFIIYFILLFLKYLFIFTTKTDIQRGETERKIFHSLVHPPSECNGLVLHRSRARSQELSQGLPHRCRIPKHWAVLDCFPRPQAWSWMGSGAARIRTGAHMVSLHIQGEDFSHLATPPGLKIGMFLYFSTL